MCFALMNTSPQISEGRVLMISRAAKGQQRSAVVEEEMGEFMGGIQCDI